MSVLPLGRLVRRALTISWDLCGELVSEALFVKVTAYDTSLQAGVASQQVATAVCNVMKLYYSSHDFDGVSLVYGDEKWLVRATELAEVSPDPSAGDWFEVLGKRWDVKAVIVDATRSLWTFQVRAVTFDASSTVSNSVDWGGLTAETSSEDWGDLALFDSTEDLAI